MSYRNIVTVLILAALLLSCGRAKEQSEQEKTGEAKTENARAHQDETTGLITLSPEAIKQAGIKTGAVSLMPLRVEHTFSGKVSVNETRLAHVGPRISGRAVEVYASLGDYVEKGQRLAIIDSPEIGEAQSQYLKAKTALQVAEKSYERAKIILEGKVISTGEFQRREGEYLSAQAEAKAAEDRLHLLGMTDEEIASIGKTHAISSMVAIYSPISGSVIERHLAIGEVVEPVKPLFVIADLFSVWVIADIPEKDIPNIKKGQGVKVLVAPYPDEAFRGTISYISETIDQATRTVKVRAEVENRKGMLKPEMFATINITSSERMKLLAVPASAVQLEGDKTVVFVARNESAFEKRVVEIGPETDGFHQALSGLKEGERIVTKGAFTLKSESMKELMEEE